MSWYVYYCLIQWGNSRFARQANNYFGQWCFTKDCGLVPLRRSAGARHEVQYFASVDLSVRAYIHNLNTSASYKLLRNLRHSLRRQHKPLDAEFLAMGLKDYSERGMDYVRIIQGMIRSNQTWQISWGNSFQHKKLIVISP